jgi:hypothetical protein
MSAEALFDIGTTKIQEMLFVVRCQKFYFCLNLLYVIRFVILIFNFLFGYNIILEFTCTISLSWELIWSVGFTPVLGGSHSPAPVFSPGLIENRPVRNCHENRIEGYQLASKLKTGPVLTFKKETVMRAGLKVLTWHLIWKLDRFSH